MMLAAICLMVGMGIGFVVGLMYAKTIKKAISEEIDA